MGTTIHSPLTVSTRTPVLTARQQRRILLVKFTRLVLFCHILMMFKPAVPLVADALAHTFWEQQHLMAVHEVHGQFHIHTELSKAAHQSDSEKSNELKYEIVQYVHVTPSVFKSNLNATSGSLCAAFVYGHISGPYLYIISPPPQPSAQDSIPAAMIDGSLFRA